MEEMIFDRLQDEEIDGISPIITDIIPEILEVNKFSCYLETQIESEADVQDEESVFPKDNSNLDISKSIGQSNDSAWKETPIFSDDESEIIDKTDNEDFVTNKESIMNSDTDTDDHSSQNKPSIISNEQLDSKISKRSKVVKENQNRTRNKSKETAKIIPVNAVLDSEIETAKQLESGPSEAEIRRRKLIEVDEDVLDVKIEKLHQITINLISGHKVTDKEHSRNLNSCKKFLRPFVENDLYSEFLEVSLEKNMSKVFNSDDMDIFPFDPLDYLKKSSDQSDEDTPKEGPVIDLSDSEEESDLEIISDPSIRTKQAYDKKAVELKELEERKKKYLLAQSRPQSSRTALLTSLRQKVHETANENYCTQMRVQREQLQTRLQIAEKCRQLVELLKLRHETRRDAERAERRRIFQENAQSNEEEFDDEVNNALDRGKVLTEAEKKAILEQFNASDDEEEDVEEENDGDDDDNDGGDDDDEPAMEVDAENVIMEEMDAARDAVLDSRVNSALLLASNEKEGDEADGDVSDGAEEVQTPLEETGEAPDEGLATETETYSTAVYGSSSQDDAAFVAVDIPTGRLVDAEDPDEVVVQYGRVHRKLPPAASHDDEEGQSPGDDEGETEQVEVKKKTPGGNSQYRMQVEREEERLRKAKKAGGMFDDEAEEEEEEGQQAGLGDFGFGVVSKIRENDEEANALKMREGDLDHIVDDVSDGEGDEEAAVKARVEMEVQEDRERTRAVITAVTEGRDAFKKSVRKGKYTFDKLVGDKKTATAGGADGPGGEEEEEMDMEEMLQKGLAEKVERDRRSRTGRGGGDSDSDSFDEADIDELDDGFDDIVNSDDLTEQQKAAEVAKLARQKEQERAEARFRKQMMETTKMNRELRRLAASQSNSHPTAAEEKEADLLGGPEAMGAKLHDHGTNQVGAIKRRTSLVPQQKRSNALVRSKSSSMYKGVLSRAEVASGFGMGMAVNSQQASNHSLDGGGLFSAVVGPLSRSSSLGPAAAAYKRSFSGTLKRRSSLHGGSSGGGGSGMGLGSSTLTVASQQFVFMSGFGDGADSQMDGGNSSFSRLDSTSKASASVAAPSRGGSSMRRTESLSGVDGTGGHSLFAKLKAKAGPLRTSKVAIR